MGILGVKLYDTFEAAEKARDASKAWPTPDVLAHCGQPVDGEGYHLVDENGEDCLNPRYCDGYCLRPVKGYSISENTWVPNFVERDDGTMGWVL
jgi:hypothetical protein